MNFISLTTHTDTAPAQIRGRWWQFKMRHLLIIILTTFHLTAHSQDISSIDKLKVRIDNLLYTDTVIITDTIFDLKGYEEKEIQGFRHGDTLVKTIAKFKNSSRIRVSYFSCLPNYQNKVVYVKDFDEKTNDLLIELYAWDEEILKSNIIKASNNYTTRPSDILRRSDYSTKIGFKIVDRDALKYWFTGRLIEKVPFTPGCGKIAWAVVHKYEVINTTYQDYPNKYVLVIQPCPEFNGEKFFIKNQTYRIYASTNSGVTFSHVVSNQYEKAGIPIFWSEQTTMYDR